MRYVIPSALVLSLIAALAMYVRWRRRRNDQLPDYGIFLCLPLLEPVELDVEELMRRFQARWGTRVGCGENPRLADPVKAMRGYMVTDGQNSLLLTVSARPLDAELTEVSLAANWHMTTVDEGQKARLRDHKAYVLVRYALGSEEPLVRARFSAQVLMTLLDLLDGAVGYINVRGQLYAPREALEDLPDDVLEPAGFFLLLANTHFVESGSGLWIHTHGLEQFGLPDLEIRPAEGHKAGEYWELIGDTAAYVIKHGPVLKPGHTSEHGGDGVVYRIREARSERGHAYGPYGALELVEP